MSELSSQEQLAGKRYLTVVLRLLLNRRNRLAYGEVVDVEGRTIRRFTGWRNLTQAVRRYVLDSSSPTSGPAGSGPAGGGLDA